MEHEDDPFGEPEDEVTELELSTELPVPHSHLADIFLFISKSREQEDITMSIIRHYLNDLYDEYSAEFPERDLEGLASDIVIYLSRRHKWEVELLWDKKDAEDMLFKKHNTYDPRIWEKVLDTEAIREMHRIVYDVSQHYLDKALEEVLHPTKEIKKRTWGKRPKDRD